MTAALVSISPDDLDKPEACPVARALAHLAAVHQLPALRHLTVSTDARPFAAVTVTESAAELWRAALAAPRFSPAINGPVIHHTTEVFWFGAVVQLSYTTL